MKQKLEQYLQYKRILEETQDILDVLKADIIAYMDGKDTIAAGYHTATYKPYTSTRIDTKALKAADPSLYDKYSVPSTTYRFTVK
jgi:predicted phage-related endonuclease